MAVMTEFIDLIVPVAIIEEKYPGGWEQCLSDHKRAIGGRVWFDDHLFRDGAMHPDAMDALLKAWWKMGFECYTEKDGVRQWKDLCVYEGLHGGLQMPCEWLGEDPANRTLYLRGTQPGEIKGRDWDLCDEWEAPVFPGL
ncbi:MAG: hypothetical protein HGA99_01540 [Chlorobiaceae bacterium]|nr:hypothetical protein [Chlorobiaceae bacterium]